MTPAIMLRRTCLIFAAAIGGCCTQEAASADTGSPAATIKLAEWGASRWSTPYRRTLALMSDNSVAVLLCGLQKLAGCQLMVADFSNGKVEIRRQTMISSSASEIRRVGEQGIMVSFDFKTGHKLYSPELAVLQNLPNPRRVSISGNTIATEAEDEHIAIYRIAGAGLSKIGVLRTGEELEAISDGFVVVRGGDAIQTRTIEGKPLGAFKVKPRRKCATEVDFTGRGRLYLQTCFHDSIVDYQGNTLSRFRAPSGWGWRRGWSEDGRRLIYDHYTRHISLLRNAGETALAVATLGVGAVDETANGETVRVLDTATGKTCFEWNSPKLPGIATGYHADVSPSGKYAAIITDEWLSIYALPDTCGQK